MNRPRIVVIEHAVSPPLRRMLRDSSPDRFEFTIAAGADDESLSMADCIVLVGEIDESVGAIVDNLKNQFTSTPVLLLANPFGEDRLLELLARGVNEFLFVPVSTAEIAARLLRIVGRHLDHQESVRRLKSTLGLRHLIGESPPFVESLNRIPLVAKCDSTVLIQGETGTGKELFARAIHYLSLRTGKPFVAINCGAIPSELVENELFGHAAAAYTSASTSRHGLIHEARGGTLFLDEIDSLSPPVQVKLLRFLQEKEYRPVGSPTVHKVDVRLLAALNSDPEQAVRTGQMRPDFFYRLNVLPLRLPPLRERHGDIPILSRHFLTKYAKRAGCVQPTLTTDALLLLSQHDWPGNVRELEHVIERALVLADGDMLLDARKIQLPFTVVDVSLREAKRKIIATFERSYIENLLTICRGNISHAARTAKKNRRAFFELIRKHEIDVGRFRQHSTVR